jgi:hypothetical protein
MQKQETVFLDYDQALDLVERIADRAWRGHHNMMVKAEKRAMAQLLSDIGVSTNDLIDVSNLADNYVINGDFVTPEKADDYSQAALQDALFSWEYDGEKYYCLTW